MPKSKPKPKLISFTVCPFVQRAVIALNEKGVAYDIEFIDLSNKPQWFLDISPRGKVPVLIADGMPLFESQAIVEYLDETQSGQRLAPEDARLRARDRAWFSYASEEIFSASWKVESAKNADALADAITALQGKLKLVEEALHGRDYLSGDGSHFGLADVGYAPQLYRFAAWKRKAGIDDILADMPNLSAWSQRILSRPTVADSVPDSWEADLEGMAKALGSQLASAMG